MRKILLAACATTALAACNDGMNRQAGMMPTATTAAASSTNEVGTNTAGALPRANVTDTTGSMATAPEPIAGATGAGVSTGMEGTNTAGALPGSSVMDTTGSMTSVPEPIGTVRQREHTFAGRSGSPGAGKAANFMDTTNSTVTDPGASGTEPTAITSSNIFGGAPTLNERRAPASGRPSATGSTVAVARPADAAVAGTMAGGTVGAMGGEAAMQGRGSPIMEMSQADLMGADVVDGEGRRIGQVTEVVRGAGGQGAQAVMVEAGPYLGTGQRTVMIPGERIQVAQGDGGELVVESMAPGNLARIEDYDGQEVFVLAR